MFKKILIIGLIFLLQTFSLQAKDLEPISGEIISGYRVLLIGPDDKNVSLTVYRGDYIKFSYPEGLGSLPFVMEQMKYKGNLQPDPDKSPYYKMKVAGSYTFSLGQMGGTIKVIELVRPNYTEVTAAQAATILDNVKPFILDVRTRAEYVQFNMAGSTLIPIQELQMRIAELEPRKHEDVFIYCATGNRSTVAARILADRGFKRIYNLRYGIYDWAKRGFPYRAAKR